MASESRIIVKFRPDLITIPYRDAAEQVLPAFTALAWQQLVSQFPGAVLSLNRLMTTKSQIKLWPSWMLRETEADRNRRA